MKLMTQAQELGKKITLVTAAFVLAVSTLTASVPFILAQSVSAIPGPEIVYNALPSVVPPTNYPSYGMQAHSINEYGDHVVLGGSNRVLNTVTFTMSNWAKHSSYALHPIYGANSATWTHPITVNVYDKNLNLLATKEQSVSIPWRPESNPDCGNTSNGKGWKVGDTCYDVSGLAFNATFDLSASKAVLPSEVIVALEYDTRTRGDSPRGVAGPYDSLNFTFPANQPVSVGSDFNTLTSYADASWNAGYGTLAEFETNASHGTQALQITALPVDTSSTNFVNDPKYVRANTAGDLTAQLVTPDSTDDVRFFINGDTSNPLSGANVGGAGATTSWWRLYTPLAPGAYEISAEIKAGDVWYDVADVTTTYSLDTPTASYVSPSSGSNTFRPSDNPVRVKAEDQFEQFSKMRVTISGVTYEVLRADCDLRAAGNYVLCDVDKASNWTGLASGTYTATTSVYTKANNRLDNLVSSSFTIDSTAPVNINFVAPTGVIPGEFTLKASAEDPESGVESVNFYITEPRIDGACTGNGTKLFEQRVNTAAAGFYTVNVDVTLNGEYCLNAVARNNAQGNGEIARQKVVIDSLAPTVAITSPTGSLFNTDVPLRITANDDHLRHYFLEIKRNGSIVNIPGVTGTQLNGVGFTDKLVATLTEEGSYQVKLAARDTAGGGSATGNRSADVVKTFTIDKSVAKPVNLAWLGDGNTNAINGFTNVQEGVLSWKAVNPADVDHYVYKFWTNIPGYQDDSSNPWFDSFTYVVKTSDGGFVPTNFSDKQGTYFFCVEAVDAAGNNSGCSDVLQITFDNTAPVAVLDSLPSLLVRGTIEVTGSVTDNIGLSHYNLSLYNGTVDLSDGEAHAGDRIATTGWTTSGQTTVSGVNESVSRMLDTTKLADGVYQIRLGVRDLAQNRGAESVDYYSITVDNTPITVAAATFARTGNTITPNVTTGDETPVSQAWTQTSGPVGGVTISDPNALTPTFTVLQDGTYEFELAVTDAAGNASTGLFTFAYTTPTQTTVTTTTTTQTQGGGDDSDSDQNGGFTGPAFTPQTNTPGELGASDEANNNSGVDGASTEKNLAQAVNNTDGNAFGLAWYWWLLILAGGATGAWWLFAAIRNRSAE